MVSEYGAPDGKNPSGTFVWNESGDGNVAPTEEMSNAFYVRVAAQDASALAAAFPGAQALGAIGEDAGFLTPVLPFAQVREKVNALADKDIKVLSLIRKL